MSTYNTSTNMWEVDGTDTFEGFARTVIINRIIYIPSAAGDELVFQDTADSQNAIVLKAGASDASPIHLDLSTEGGRRVNGLKCTTIDGGTAYVYFK